MPELPEVETSRRGIEPYLHNKTITGVKIRQHKLRWPIPKNLPDLASGQKVRQVCRRAKYIYLRLDNGSIIIHLGMSGSLRICSGEAPVDKHDHVDFVFLNRRILRLRDPRKFGAVLWTSDTPENHPLLSALGPEPLQDAFNGRYLYERTRNRSASIKSLIMNSHIVVGVGNIYACESLYLAGINPKRKAGTVSSARCEKLVSTIKRVLNASISQGGTTLRDFVREDGMPGYYAQQLFVYGRAGEPCKQCGRPINQISQQQRSTFYCTHCQR